MSDPLDVEIVSLLRKSMNEIGCLQPIIVDKNTGEVLIGRHRHEANPSWERKEIEVKDALHKKLLILHGNVQRKVPEEETRMHLIDIAKILETRGIPKNKICTEIIKLPTPYSPQWIERLLPSEYKMMEKARQPQKFDKVVCQKPEETKPTFKTALDSTTPEDNPYPYPNCLCKNCTNKSQCYGI